MPAQTENCLHRVRMQHVLGANDLSARFFRATNAGLLALILLAANSLAVAQTAPDSDSLATLRRRQTAIERVVARQSLAVVAVTDGVGFGSGVIVSADGLVLTAGHVLGADHDQYRVILPSGKEVAARPLGKNANVDSGMIQITEGGNYPFVELGNNSESEVGDWCVCLGHPGGFKLGRRAPVRAGKILEHQTDALVTDCALIGGDSGGPLFDLAGNLIGIHSSIGNHIATNRHVSIDRFKKDWKRLKAKHRWGSLPGIDPAPNVGDVPHQPRSGAAGKAALGVTVEPSESAAQITRIRPSSVAANAGIQVGDVVTAIDGEPIDSSAALIAAIASRQPGQRIVLLVQRDHENFQIELSLGKWGVPN